MTAPSTGKPSRKPRTPAERIELAREVEQRVKDATPRQKAAHQALADKHRAKHKAT